MSAARPRLSVVVPTHDTRELTTRCFRALVAACGPGCERILVDDGSTDGTAEAVAREDPHATILRRPGPSGFAAAANAGLAAASGDVLWLLNSDTEVDPDAPRALLAAFDANPWLGVAGAELRSPDGRPLWSGGAAPGLAWLFVLGTGLAPLLAAVPGWRRVKHPGATSGVEVDWVSGAALAIRRDVWLRATPLDESFRFYGQDLDLCLRVRDLGWQVQIARGVGVVHHEGATIARRGRAVGERYVPELLWPDLVHAVARRSPARARLARRALLSGARLRVALRRALAPLVPRTRRADFARDTHAFAAGVAALRRYPGERGA